jgi:hypothetical protein
MEIESETLVANQDQSLVLAHLLSHPQKNSVEWQSRVVRLVSIAHVKTLAPDTSDLEYFRLLALCKWAHNLGVSEARKRNLQASRFRQRPPPSLALLSNGNEVSAALELLSELRADWCKSYIAEIASSDLLDKAQIARACDWASKTAIGIGDLVLVVLKTRLDAPVDDKLSEVWIKQLTEKASSAAQWPSAASAAADFYSAMLTVLTILGSRQVPKVLTGLIWKFLVKVIDLGRIAHPLILTEPSLLSALKTLVVSPLAVSQKKEVGLCVAGLVAPTLSCLATLIERGGRESEKFAKELIPLLVAAFPDFAKRLTESAARFPALAFLVASNSDSGSGVVNLEDEAASIYARLLPAWIDFYSTYPEAEKISVMNANLLLAARVNGIELSGVVGEVVQYDPIAHRTVDSGVVQPSHVRLLRPAVVFRRSNGSYRVVLPALVSGNEANI